jgi:hypothetical protein
MKIDIQTSVVAATILVTFVNAFHAELFEGEKELI